MSMLKHITLCCDGPGCGHQLATGQLKYFDAQVFAMKTYGWSTMPGRPPGSGGKRWDLCANCTRTVTRPGTEPVLRRCTWPDCDNEVEPGYRWCDSHGI